ncbi:MAG TPA: polysaccharide deacetylase family protein [Acidimicrobiia bacterium]|nr:polysaccharide deacetylase family protein [Acidimicrobiia bacterium]
MLPTHGRFEYSPITLRPEFSWPGGRRLAVYVAICIEHFSYGEGGLGLSYSPGIPHPNTYNWAWREYGNRVGGWRLLDVFEQHGVTPTALINTSCYDHCPELIDAYRAAGTEFVAHGHTNSVQPNDLDEKEERVVIRGIFETMSAHEGKPPAGWMSPGANPSAVTEDLLAETGFVYTLDWPMDDQPTWMRTRGGPLLSVPYPHEVNDVPMIVLHHGTAPAFADMMTDNLDEMVEQARHQPLVLGIVAHTFIMGQPYRLRRFRAALEHLVGIPDVWLTTPGEIAAAYAGIVAPDTAFG